MSKNKSIGDFYENQAVQWVLSENLTIVARNYNVPKIGEIDIIAQSVKTLPNGKAYKTLIFIEVRARKRGRFATSVQSITPAKQRKITQAAMKFVQDFDKFGEYDCRFDVMAFDYDDIGVSRQWIKSAFLAMPFND